MITSEPKLFFCEGGREGRRRGEAGKENEGRVKEIEMNVERERERENGKTESRGREGRR